MNIFKLFGRAATRGLCSKCAEAASGQFGDCERALGELDKRVDAALSDPRLSVQSQRFLKQQWYGDPHGVLSLGNRLVHAAAMVASIKVILRLAHSDQKVRKGRLRLRMLTTIPDSGLSDFRGPRLRLNTVRNHFYFAARNAEVDALGFVDLAQVLECDALNPPSIAIHMHGIVRGRDPSFKVKKAEKAATPPRSPINKFGLKTVKISSKKRNRGPALSRHDVSYLAYYVRKPSCGLKLISARKGVRKTVTTLHGWNTTYALRQLECLTHLDALKTTVGVGAGRHWRFQWKAELLQLLDYDDTCRGAGLDHCSLANSWQRIWDELSSGNTCAKVT